MQRLFVYLLYGICGVSATRILLNQQFRYTKHLNNNEECNLCYGEDDCLTMDEARCQYYMKTSKLIDDDDHDDHPSDVATDLKYEVDNMLYDLVNKATTDPQYQDCIPLVSQYTDCSKENICTGCNTCQCNAQGKWNCSVTQQCTVDPFKFNIDHRVLLMVMESLNNEEKTLYRKKRSNEDKTKTEEGSKLTYEQLSEWLYGVHPLSAVNNTIKSITTENTTKEENASIRARAKIESITTPSKLEETTMKSEIEYLAFDDVLNEITGNNKNYNRRKPPLDIIHDDTILVHDYTDLDKNVTFNNDVNESNQFVHILNAIEGNDATESEASKEAQQEGATTVYIDLFQTINNQTGNNVHDRGMRDYLDLDNNLNYEPKPIAGREIGNEFNNKNVMKREVSQVSQYTTKSSPIFDNETFLLSELNENILFPLTNIITGKQKELQALLNIKQGLIDHIKRYHDGDIPIDNANETLTNNSSHFTIYKLQIDPQSEVTSHPNHKDYKSKLLYKLKHDIIEVIKDTAFIHKLYKTRNLPQNLRILMGAMKYYLDKQITDRQEEKLLNTRRSNFQDINLKKQWPSEYNMSNWETVKELVIKIFELIDKDMPKANALGPLSTHAKKVIKRIVKNNYVNEFAVNGLRVYNPHYNVTNDLKTIGTKWRKMAMDVTNNPPTDRLYKMKLLHLVLSTDVNKMMEVSALLNFARNRGIMPVDRYFAKGMLERINDFLAATRNKVNQFLAYQHRNKKVEIPNKIVNSQNNIRKKMSFMKQIKNLLKKSKNDIMNLINKKVSKSDIVKELARKKLDSMTRRKLSQYEETMQRWQENLNIAPARAKRSAREFNKNNNRIRNIIPNYLRGKVNPAISAKDSKKTKVKHTLSKKKVQNKKRKIVKTTTDKTKTSFKLKKWRQKN